MAFIPCLHALTSLMIVSQATSEVQQPPWAELVRPGCLIEHIGTLYPITEHIQVKIDLNLIPDLEERIRLQHKISQRLTTALDDLVDLSQEYKHPLNNILTSSSSSLASVLRPSAPIRQARGLFNAGGMLANFLFGITTDNALNERLTAQNGAINSVIHTVSTALESFKDINDKLSVLSKTSNIISTSLGILSNETDQLKHFTLLAVSLSLFNTQVHQLERHLSALTEGLVLASHGEIIPSLLPERELQRILWLFTSDSSRQALFPLSDIHLYYPYLTAILSPTTLNILIPLMPLQTFQASRIHPFPSNHNGSVLVATVIKDIVLRSTNGQMVSTLSSSDYGDCQTAIPNMTICFNLILPEQTYLAPSCARSLLTNLHVNTYCMFDELALTTPFHTSFSHMHFLFFPEKTTTVVTCNGTHNDIVVTGFFVVPTSCSLHSSVLSLKAHNILHAHLKLTPGFLQQTNITLPYHHVKIPTTHIRFLPSNESTHFVFPSYHVTYGFPSLMSVLPILFLVVGAGIYYVHKRKTHVSDTRTTTAKAVNQHITHELEIPPYIPSHPHGEALFTENTPN